MAYGSLVVLKSVDLTVPAGQKLAIIGRERILVRPPSFVC